MGGVGWNGGAKIDDRFIEIYWVKVVCGKGPQNRWQIYNECMYIICRKSVKYLSYRQKTGRQILILAPISEMRPGASVPPRYASATGQINWNMSPIKKCCERLSQLSKKLRWNLYYILVIVKEVGYLIVKIHFVL